MIIIIIQRRNTKSVLKLKNGEERENGQGQDQANEFFIKGL